jgi:hypothetical protein
MKPVYSFVTKTLLSALCLLAAPAVSHATIYLRNTGSTSGWSSLYVEHNGSMTSQTSQHYDGTTSLRARQVYDSSYTGRYHCEARYSQGAKMGWDRYYGYCFYLPSNWQYVDQNFNIMQFIGTPPCSTSGKPWTMLWIRNHALATRVTTGPDGCTRTDTDFTITSSATAGVWHTVLLHGIWKPTSTGTFSCWYDGTKVISHTGDIATCPNSTETMEFAIGNYANGWHDNGTMLGTQSTRDIYIDHVSISDVYGEANPTSW